MTEEEFSKKSYKKYMIIDFHHPKSNNVAECLLLSVEFELCQFQLRPIPNSYIEEEDFWVYCKYCEIPKKKLKIA
jgi:hypothetical protein